MYLCGFCCVVFSFYAVFLLGAVVINYGISCYKISVFCSFSVILRRLMIKRWDFAKKSLQNALVK